MILLICFFHVIKLILSEISASAVALESVGEIHERITIVLPWRDCLQKPARKEPRIAESCRDRFVDLILGNDIDLLTDVTAGRVGIRSDGYGAVTCIQGV